jgi:hypothetical protein
MQDAELGRTKLLCSPAFFQQILLTAKLAGISFSLRQLLTSFEPLQWRADYHFLSPNNQSSMADGRPPKIFSFLGCVSS